jgi:hypothetical protein
MKRGFWRRPESRIYKYNLDVGEHYYSPMTSYLEQERGSRGEAPGALTYSERLARKWLHGRRYEGSDVEQRFARASSAVRESSSSAGYSRGARASSCTPFAGSDPNNVSAFGELDSRKLFASSTSQAQSQIAAATSARRAGSASREVMQQQQQQERMSRQQQHLLQKQMQMRQEEEERSGLEQHARMSRQQQHSMMQKQMQMSQEQQEEQRMASSKKSVSFKQQVVQQQNESRNARQEHVIQSSCQRSSGCMSDDICKRVADVRMQPWSAGAELDAAQSASAKARCRIADLERELDVVTKKAIMTSSHAMMTASALAKAAMIEDEAAMKSSYKKSKKVMVTSSSKIARA